MLGTLILGWILTWFNLDNMVVEAINQIYNTNYTVVVYWLIIFILSIIVGIIKK